MAKKFSRVKLNDRVEVIAGKDKGRVGKVIKVFRSADQVLVEKVNMIKRHTKPSSINQQGGIIEKEAPIHVSNVQMICPQCAKTSRIGKKVLEDGQGVRFCKKCGETIEPKA